MYSLPQKVFMASTLLLPKLTRYTPKWLFYKLIEQLFLRLNKRYPIRRKNVPPITQENLSLEPKDSNIYISVSFFYQTKQLWVSWVARLKNADEFLSHALESYLPFVDELILVDNNSTDNTVEICENFLHRYPKKVKFYRYVPDVLHYGLDHFQNHTSPHSLAYYYNRCFAKATKSHVLKIDDDNIALPKPYEKLITKALTENKPGFYATRGLNIFEKDGKLGAYGDFPYTGRYGDHGIYKITPRTYYTQNNSSTEQLLYPYSRSSYEFAILHLKQMKKASFINITDPKLHAQRQTQQKEAKVSDFQNFISATEEKEVRGILHTIL